MIDYCKKHKYLFKHWRENCPGCELDGEPSPWGEAGPPRAHFLSEASKKKRERFKKEYKKVKWAK